MVKTRKIPMRRCVGCREMKEKKSLIRIVRNAEGEIFADPTGKKNGRGAYLCKDMACYEKARKSRALNREFEAEIPDQVYEDVRRQLEAYVDR